MYIQGAELSTGLKIAMLKFVIHVFKRIPKEYLQFAAALKESLPWHMLATKALKAPRVPFIILVLKGTKGSTRRASISTIVSTSWSLAGSTGPSKERGRNIVCPGSM